MSLKIYQISDYKSFEEVIESHLLGERFVIVNHSSSVHYFSLQYFKRLLFHLKTPKKFDFVLDTDNNLTICLEAIDLLFSYIIFSGEEEIMAKLRSRAIESKILIFNSLTEAINYLTI